MYFCDVPDADMIHEWLLFTPLACQDESSTLSNNLFLSFIQTKWDSDFQQENWANLRLSFSLLWLQNN